MLVKLCFDTVVNQHTSCTIYFLTDEHMRKTRLAFLLYGQFPSYIRHGIWHDIASQTKTTSYSSYHFTKHQPRASGALFLVHVSLVPLPYPVWYHDFLIIFAESSTNERPENNEHFSCFVNFDPSFRALSLNMNRNFMQNQNDSSSAGHGYFFLPDPFDSPSSRSGNQEQHQVPSAPLLEKPKRPLSGYNLFFQDERVRLLEVLPGRPDGKKPRRSHGKLGFKDMATIIGQRWRELDTQTKRFYENLAKEEKVRYRRKRAAYLRQQDMLLCKEKESKEKEELEPIWWDELSPVRIDDGCTESGICQLASKLDEESINLIVQAFR